MSSTTVPATTAPASVGVRRLLAAPGPTLADHVRTHGPLPAVGPGLVDELARAGVDGRGGAGFPLAQKVAAVARAAARSGRRTPVVVANGAEGEPASRKDAVLLERSPHLVLDGLVLVAGLVGAREAVVATTAAGADHVHRALAERRDPVGVSVRVLPHTSFVAGEASALASALAGRRGVPQDRGVRLAERGPTGAPTLVSNVETLAQAALVARRGAAWATTVGTASAPGTRLVTVSDVRDPATALVLEIAGGTPLGDVVRASRLGVHGVRAVLVGGWGGTWVPAAALDATFDPAGLGRWGASPGAGVVAVLREDTCPVTVTARIATALAGASAGRCGPCVNGLPRVAETMAALASGGHGTDLAAEVRRYAAAVDGRGACHHPDGVARMVRSALSVFHDDVQAHLAGTCTVRGGGRPSTGRRSAGGAR